MSILCQNLDLNQSSLTFFQVYFTFEKNFQILQKFGAFFLNTQLMKLF